MEKYYHSRNRSEFGQSLTEFALILVFLLALLAGVFDLGRAFFAYIIIRDAAQEGAVYGSIAQKDDLAGFNIAVADRVEAAFLDPDDTLTTPIDLAKMNVQVDILGAACAAPGNSVRVEVDYSFPISMPFLGALIGKQDIMLSAQAENSILAPICP